jgi:hypothetical protein
MKRMLTNSSLMLVGVMTLVFVGLAPSSPVTTDPEISAIVNNVDSNRILETATTMQNFRTRQSCSDQPEPGHGVTAARDFRRAGRQ